MAEKRGETAHLTAIERKVEELGPSLIQMMEDRWKKKQKEEGAGGETTGEDNSRGRSEEPKESSGVRVGERAKRGRQAAFPTHTANIGGDHHTEGQVGQILRGGVGRGQG
jgi:hypothetical protein